MTLFVCDDVVAAVREELPGDLDEFALLVDWYERGLGEPDMQIATFMAGATRISNVDVQFAGPGNSGASVQLASTGGKLAIFTNHWDGSICSDEP